MSRGPGRRAKKKTEGQETAYGTHWLCAGCAEKIRRTQELWETEDFKTGRCEGCMQFYSLSRYLSRPYPKEQHKRRTGGGERARAGGDA